MLPSNIDLTENRDFGIGSNNFIDTPIEIPIDDYRSMSTYEYEKLMQWENIFGKRNHYNQKSEIFDYESKYLVNERKHCYRCGKLIQFPWDNVGGICRKCDEIICNDFNNRIPWKNNNFQSTNEREVFYNLFNRR